MERALDSELKGHDGEERLVTGPEAGITRDAIAVDLTWHGRPMRVHDTAGLRRRSRVDEGSID